MKRQKTSLLKRLIYLVLLVSGGSAGVGGWVFKDHPRMQALWTLWTGDPADLASSGEGGKLVSEAIDALKPREDFRRAGAYEVRITKVDLDPALFQPGRTVDIQAKVLRRDAHGRDATLWDSKSFGERLAVVGKDELSAGWPDRPFQVDWKPGEQLVLQVIERKTGLFNEPTQFTLAGSDPAATEFPLKTGDFPLELAHRADSHRTPGSHVVLQSRHAGEPGKRAATDVAAMGAPTDVDERPIVIK
jgi:hypothetical protein